MFSRAQSQQVLLFPWPLSYTLDAPSGDVGARLSLLIDADELEPASVVIQGKAIDSAGGSMAFNAVATEPRLGVDLSALKAAGQYKVEATLFGTTRLGREVQLQLPVKSFTIMPPPAPIPSAASPTSAAVATQAKFEERESPVWLPWALGGGGLLLLLLGAGGFILLQKRRTLHKVMAAQKAQSEVVPPAPKLDLNLPEQ
ncbi:hypothetical protein D3C85_1244490 [compost metagenome]